jgi:four helix bundle protein
MAIERFEDIEAWKKARALATAVYKATKEPLFSKDFSLRDQVQRAAVSVPANLAEGLGRGTPKEIARFAQIALGSLYELDTLLCLAAELAYSPQDAVAPLRERLTTLAKRISAFITYQETRQ